jgi:hypothetical protein
MTIQPINIGAAPNDNTGDPIRNAFLKSNANFTELYSKIAAALAVGGGNITLTMADGTTLSAPLPPGLQLDTVVAPKADGPSGAVGVSTKAAHGDHKHGAQLPSAALGNGITVGADGLHYMGAVVRSTASPAPVAQVPSAGVSPDVSRADHVHKETLTAVAWNNATKMLRYTDEAGIVTIIDLSGLALDLHVTGAVIGANALTLTVSDGVNAPSTIVVDLSTLKQANVSGSLTGDGDTLPIKLVGDVLAPGNSYYYGTNAAGAKGFYPIPAGVAVVDVLTDPSATKALAAHQGVVLNGADVATVTIAAGVLTLTLKGGATLTASLPAGIVVDDNLTTNISTDALSAKQGVILNSADIASVSVAGGVLTLTKNGGGTLTATLPATTVEDLLTSISAINALSANQGRMLNAADVASGSVSGNNLTLALKGGGTVVVDVTSLAADVKVVSGSYNSVTQAIDFVCSPASANFSVPVAALLPVNLDPASSLVGNGAATGLKLSGDVAAPGNSKYYGTDALGAKGYNDLPTTPLATAAPLDPASASAVGTSVKAAREDHKHKFQPVSADTNNELLPGADGLHHLSMQAARWGVPATGKYALGWENGILSAFPIA